MRAQVHIRRRFGKRLPPRDEGAQEPIAGELQFGFVTHGSLSMAVLDLHASGNTAEDGTLARLYEPVLVGLGGYWISFRGYESINSDDGPTSFVQEWRCYVSP